MNNAEERNNQLSITPNTAVEVHRRRYKTLLEPEQKIKAGYLAGGDDRPALLPIKDVARLLSVSLSFVYKLIEQGILPCVRLGAARRVRPSDLEAYIEDNLSRPTLPRV